jgi:MFS family permease
MTETKPKFSIAPLLAVNFVGTLGLSIVTPFLVVLVVQWGGNALVYGILAATYSLFQIAGASVLGKMSDRVGRRRVLLLSQMGTWLSWGVFLFAFAVPEAELFSVENRGLGDFALTLPLFVLFLARAADGLTGGNVSVSNAYLADVTTEETRSRDFGRMAVSGNVGYVVGPALAGVLGATVFGEILPVIAAFVISGFALMLIRFGLSEIKPSNISQRVEEPTACEVLSHENKAAYQINCEGPDGIGAILSMPNMRALMAINFLVMLAFNIFYVVFPVHALQGMDWDVAQIGVYFAVVSLIMIVVQGPGLAYAVKRLSDRNLMWCGGVVLAIGFGMLLVPLVEPTYLAGALIAVGNGLMWPTFMSVLSDAGGTNLQGSVQGYAQSLGAIASIIGLVLGGLAYVSFGPVLFLVAGVFVALSALLAATYCPPRALETSA